MTDIEDLKKKIKPAKQVRLKKSLLELDADIAEKREKYKAKAGIARAANSRLNKLKKSRELLANGGIAERQEFDEELVETKEVIWEPHEGVQTEFLKSTEYEVLFAGGRGSGKSDALIVDPLRYCGNGNFRALVIRKTMKELRELFGRAKKIYPKAYPGAKIKEQDKMIVFPSGATVEFGYCDSDDDVEQYQGQEYTWLGVDEITQYSSPRILEDLKASMRNTDPTLTPYIRATCNPNGAGRGWVKERWIDNGPSGEKIELYGAIQVIDADSMDITAEMVFKPLDYIRAHGLEVYIDEDTGEPLKITRKWFTSKLTDNPTLIKNNPLYKATLASIADPIRRAQWLEGSWEAVEGLAFKEFKREVHVVQPFEIPNNWYKFRACDWGYSSMAVCLWFAVDWDNNVYVYREYTTSYETADEFSENILELERGEKISIGYLDGSVWSKRGEIGESVADTMLKYGLGWVPSDRSPGSRKMSKNKVHQYLKVDALTGQPRVKIFSGCTELISELSSLVLDVNDPEDIDKSKKTSLPDHAYDAFRYGLSSLPNINNNGPRGGFNNVLAQLAAPAVINSTIGM